MTIHIRKLANFFDRSAEFSLTGAAAAAAAAVERYQSKNGGLWVGGIVEITEASFSFSPNGMNRSLHTNLKAETVTMEDVIGVVRYFGWLTGIVVVTHRRGEFVFRCFGANGVARRINNFLRQRPNPRFNSDNRR